MELNWSESTIKEIEVKNESTSTDGCGKNITPSLMANCSDSKATMLRKNCATS